MLRRWMLGGLTVGLLASVLVAKPGVITTRQGETFTGDVTEDGANISVSGTGGQLTFKRANIAKVEYTATVENEYEQRHAKLTDTDIKGRIELANWANDQKRSDLAVKSLQEARQIDPTNKDAARALDSAERQMELDQPAPTKPAKTPTVAVAPPTTATAFPTKPPGKSVAVHRLLTNDEVNIIRQKEMTADDTNVKIRFENGVIKKFLSAGDHDAKAFSALPPIEQAMEILSHGDPSLAKDVKISTDPASLLEFRQKVYPLISNGCVTCHTGTRSGNFSLYAGDSPNAVYTNFYILQMYSVTIDKMKYMALDRDAPERSLVLQFGLPVKEGVPPHPRAAGWRPRFKGTADPAYLEIQDWLKNSLKVMKPDYGIDVAPTGGPPTGVPVGHDPASKPAGPPGPAVK